MKSFEFQTAALFVGVLYIVMPLFTWVVLGEARNRAAALWCLGGLTMGVATVIVGAFSNEAYPTLTLSLPTFMYGFSYVARTQSLRLDMGKPFTFKSMALVLFTSTWVFEILHHGVGLFVPRAMFASLTFVVGAGCLAFHAVQIARSEQSKMARWIGWAYGGVAFSFVFRIVYLSQQDFSRTAGNVVTDGIASVVVAFAMLLASVIGHFGYVGLFLERSQRKSIVSAEEHARAEVSQQLGAQIAVLERRQSLGELAASIGHELKQPLTAILTNAQLTKRGLQSGRLAPDVALQLLDKIESNTQRASGILERIRNFTRTGTEQRNQVDLREVARSVLQLMDADLATHSVRMNLSIPAEPLWVLADALELSQVMLNLIKNAVDSMAGIEQRRIDLVLSAAQGQAQVRVRDSGSGLSDEQHAKAGTPFFTTKQQGLGMGLAISRNIMRKHGGNLTLANANDGSGPGALAVMELPLAPEAAK